MGAAVKSAICKKNKANVLYQKNSDESEHSIEADIVLVATGRKPFTNGLGIKELGIKVSEKGYIEIDNEWRTSANGIYAIGDVTGKLPLAHVAFDQGIVAAETIKGLDVQGISDYTSMPRCTYCSPQIASIGITEDQAKEQSLNYSVGKVPFQVAGKSIAINNYNGFAKIISDSDTGEILGAHIIGAEATEMIGEIGMLKYLEGTNEELHRLTHAHPTLSEVIN